MMQYGEREGVGGSIRVSGWDRPHWDVASSTVVWKRVIDHVSQNGRDPCRSEIAQEERRGEEGSANKPRRSSGRENKAKFLKSAPLQRHSGKALIGHGTPPRNFQNQLYFKSVKVLVARETFSSYSRLACHVFRLSFL